MTDRYRGNLGDLIALEQSRLPRAITHVIAAQRELRAAQACLTDADSVTLARLTDAETYTTIALDGLRERYGATQETVPERTCECGQPLYLGTCVRCWARKDWGWGGETAGE